MALGSTQAWIAHLVSHSGATSLPKMFTLSFSSLGRFLSAKLIYWFIHFEGATGGLAFVIRPDLPTIGEYMGDELYFFRDPGSLSFSDGGEEVDLTMAMALIALRGPTAVGEAASAEPACA